MRYSKKKFILHQGYSMSAMAAREQYTALMFQPRIIAAAVAVGIALQFSWLFFALACVLTIAAVWPRLNPFDAIYNAAVAPWNSCYRLQKAPLPRRFAQALAASLLGSTALAINGSMPLLAVALELIIAGSLTALLAARFCLGASLLHWLIRLSRRPRQSLGRRNFEDRGGVCAD